MNLTRYFVALHAQAAAALGGRRQRKTALPKPAAPTKGRKPPLPSIEERKTAAFSAFPNHFGNYLGKRDPRPEMPILTPRERFIRLLGMHEERARDYRWKRQAVA